NDVLTDPECSSLLGGRLRSVVLRRRRRLICCCFGLIEIIPVRSLFLCMCGCRFRFLHRNLFGVGGGPLLYLEDLNPAAITAVGSRLSLSSASNECKDETEKCGNDTIPHGANTPHRASPLLNIPENQSKP